METGDVDECSSSTPVCDLTATCENTIGSYRCLCPKAGFAEKGDGCSDIDECEEGSHDCDVNAYCSNTVGSYTCTCKEKYYGDGKNCHDDRGLGASVILGSLNYKNYTEKLLSYLEPVLLRANSSRFVRCWHAKTDGSAASTFHTNCDRQGPTVTIIKSGDYVFGGYTDVSWQGCSYSYASKAFLFSLYNAQGYNPVKLTQYQNQQNAMYSGTNYGPTFGGGHDIYISDNALSNQNSYTECGYTYSVPSGYSAGDYCNFFTGGRPFTPTNIEVFYEIDIDECAEGTHGCDVNAYCNNTVGSYTCTCKEKYFGDGKNCTSHRGLGASVILGNLDHKNYSEKLLSYLDPVLLSSDRSGFVRCWHAKTDGWAASTFHTNCDGKGPTVTIIKYGDYVFGGYTDVSWHGCGYFSANKAFLFSLYNAKGYNPVKLTQYQNQQYAMYSCSSYGPTFSNGHDIYISNDAINNQASYTRCGSTYSVPSGYSPGDCGFFTGAFYFTPTDIEVFYEIGDLGTSAILGGLDHSKYLGKLLSYLDPVIPDAYRSEFVRCWHAKTDGSAASTFHANCDGKGPTVTIIKYGDNIFGGYTDVSWHSSNSYSSASKAFLFSLYNAQGYNPVKLTQYQNQPYAIYKHSNYGPTFGSGHDIRIYDNALSNQHSYTRCGGTYSVPSGYSAGDCTFFTGVALHFTPTDIEVFYEIGGLGESAILGDLDHNKYLGKLISYLDPVLPSASRSDFVRCWHAKTDGSAASTFHNSCDGKGPTVTIIKNGDYIFGGYTDVSWHSSGGYSSASKAFLFSLYNAQGYNPVKLTQYQNQQNAMDKVSSHGPTFGASSSHDIYISDNALTNQNSLTSCGQTYAIPSGYSAGQCGFFTGGFHFTPTDIEVFYEIGLSASVILGGLDPSKYLEILISYLDPVLISSERSRFVRCWHAKTDGSAASTFHTNCDGKGPTVTIIKYGAYVFGGYTDVSWYSSSCSYSSASKAFIFSLYNAKGYYPVKLTQYRNQQNAMYRCSNYGPTFGSHDIYILDNALSNQNSYTQCGNVYSLPSGYSSGWCKFLTPTNYFTPTDVEVFYEISN